MGLLWFVVLALGLFLLLQVGIAIYIFMHAPKGASQEAVIQGARDFIDANVGTIHSLDALTLVAAVLLAGLGTLRGSLPGTRRKVE